MLYIKKGKEPASLTQYKKTAGANYDGCGKDDIKQSLMQEQAGLCAYCMRRLRAPSEMRIEHYVSQSVSPEKALSYLNMLGVCYGGERDDGGHGKCRLTCDAHRGSRPLAVDPWDEASINKIKYKYDGTIYSEDHDINNDLHHTLNLNSDAGPHKKSREQVLLAFIGQLNTKFGKSTSWNKARLEKMRKEILDANPKPSYCGILIWFLNKHIK
ncbi:MAG: retron system putative HNH endonuclease [Cloacibacillus sp.]